MRVKRLDTIALNGLAGSLVWWRKSLPLGMKSLPIQLQGLHHATRTPKAQLRMMTCHTSRRYRLPLLCLLILLTVLPLTAQHKRRSAALPALPDTVYLLDHYQESRHWMRDPDKIKRAKAKRNYKEMINAG